MPFVLSNSLYHRTSTNSRHKTTYIYWCYFSILSLILCVEVIVLHTRIRKAREDAGYTREQFSELLDVSVSYMAEVERGKTGISVKTLLKVCNLLGLSADYVLFGANRDEDTVLLEKIRQIDSKYLPLLDKIIMELLALHE